MISVTSCERWNESLSWLLPASQQNTFWNYCELASAKTIPPLPHRQYFLICSANSISHWGQGCWDILHPPTLLPWTAPHTCFGVLSPDMNAQGPGYSSWLTSSSSSSQLHVHSEDCNGAAFKGSRHLPQPRLKPDLHLYSLLLSAAIRHVSVLVLRPWLGVLSRRVLATWESLQWAARASKWLVFVLLCHNDYNWKWVYGPEYCDWLTTRRFSACFLLSLNWR